VHPLCREHPPGGDQGDSEALFWILICVHAPQERRCPVYRLPVPFDYLHRFAICSRRLVR
jgi:hypothetical protein